MMLFPAVQHRTTAITFQVVRQTGMLGHCIKNKF
jgi:hypothetical protein